MFPFLQMHWGGGRSDIPEPRQCQLRQERHVYSKRLGNEKSPIGATYPVSMPVLTN